MLLAVLQCLNDVLRWCGLDVQTIWALIGAVGSAIQTACPGTHRCQLLLNRIIYIDVRFGRLVIPCGLQVPTHVCYELATEFPQLHHTFFVGSQDHGHRDVPKRPRAAFRGHKSLRVGRKHAAFMYDPREFLFPDERLNQERIQ